MGSGDRLLNLGRGVGQRKESIRWEVLDATLEVIGEIHPEPGATVKNNVNATIKRQLDGLTIPASEAADIDTLSNRIRPWWSVGGDEYPLGVFLFGQGSRARSTRGLPLSATLYDQTFILDQPSRSSYGANAGELVSDHLASLAAAAGITSIDITASTRTISDAIAWPAGTTRRKMMVDLCGLADLLSPYFDNEGVLVVRPAPNLSTAAPDHSYNEGPDCRIIADTILETDDLWEAANVFLVVNTAATGNEISGSYEVDASAPFSVASRGFEVVKVIDAPGIESTAAAQDRAAAAAAQETAAYRWVTFEATPDPRHDTYDIVEYRNENYREQSWTLTLAPGGPHRHELRRVYQS